MSLFLHIDRVVLEGLAFSFQEQAQLEAALTTELGRLLQDGQFHPGLAQGTAVPQLPAEPLRIPARPEPGPMGRDIARSLAHSLATPGVPPGRS